MREAKSARRFRRLFLIGHWFSVGVVFTGALSAWKLQGIEGASALLIALGIIFLSAGLVTVLDDAHDEAWRKLDDTERKR